MIETERTVIRLVEPGDAGVLRDFYLRNADHLAPWEPLRAPGYHEADAWALRAAEFAGHAERDRAFHYVARLKGQEEILACVNFSNVARGAFQACSLGYALDGQAQGRGLMHEVLEVLIRRAFEIHDLHRVMANYLPENERSAKVLARLGFEIEGHARDYLKIAGRWRDHVLTARIRPEDPS